MIGVVVRIARAGALVLSMLVLALTDANAAATEGGLGVRAQELVPPAAQTADAGTGPVFNERADAPVTADAASAPLWWLGFLRVMGVIGLVVLIALTAFVARKAMSIDARASSSGWGATKRDPHALWRYLLAVLCVTAAYGARIGIEAWTGSKLPPFVTFYPAIMFAALVGGMGPGVLAIAVAVIVVRVLVVPTMGAAGSNWAMSGIAVVLFCAMGVLTAAVAELSRRNQAKAAAYDRDRAVRLSEDRYRLLYGSMRDALVVVDMDGRIIECNDPYCEMLGYSRDELTGLTYVELTPARWHAMEAEIVSTQILPQGSSQVYEKEYRRKDGTIIPVELRTVLIEDDVRRPVQMWAIVRDVTKHKAMQNALAQAKEMAEAASQAKSRFLANMSHEIRTPLNAILGYAHLLRMGRPTPEQAERLARIEAAGRHLLAVVNDVLDLSKIEAGRLTLERIDFKVRTVLDDVVFLIEQEARSKGLTVTADAAGVPEVLRGDLTRVRQGLFNLAGNAVKFTHRGSIGIRARLEEEQADRLRIRFSVDDTGIGIPAERQADLFKEFEQLDGGTTRSFGGTGLGLSITRRLAQIMGGDAGCSSVPGQGSTFWFTVWLERGRLVTAGNEQADVRLIDALRGSRSGLRLLLVEDDPISADVVRELLSVTDCAVDIAVDGRAAVEMAAKTRYDLILMDIQMPVMDGWQATRAIRALDDCARVPILAITANAFDADRLRCIEAGMDDVVSKPIDPKQLYAALLRWVPTSSPPPGQRDSAAQCESDEIAAIPGLDVDEGLRMFNGNRKLYRHVLGEFAEEHEHDFDRARAALADGDRDALLKVTHRLLGISGTIGATPVRDAVLRLESAIKSDAAADLVEYELTMLGDALRQLVHGIRASVGRSAASVEQ